MSAFSQLQSVLRRRRIRLVLPVISLIFVLVFALSCVPRAALGPSPAKASALADDEVVFVEEPDSAKATQELEASDMQVYAGGLTDPELVRRIKASPAMGYEFYYGSTTELTFNPVGPTFPKTGELNPFSVPAIREAMNWLIDRSYITGY